jgi:transcriptional regulator with XRE-family HTH domain
MKQSKSKRRRGIVLTLAGLKRLQEAIVAIEIAENRGERFSLNELSTRMNVSTRTLSRLWSLNASIDQKTLRLCFSAFNLELAREDYAVLNESNNTKALQKLSVSLEKEPEYSSVDLWEDSFFNEQRDQLENLWSYPDGAVPLDSPFYIERPPIEELIYREVTQRGCVIRIRSPRQMGKSSLVLRLLAFAQMQGYLTATLNCSQIDDNCLTNLNQLLRCLCWRVATQLGIDPKLDEKWDQEVGCKLSCSFYFQNYLLKHSPTPVVLVLNEVDRFFEYPHLAGEFFALLRSWCEEARENDNWHKLRLVVVYSTENYLTLDINRSPFNIGLPIRLPEFTQQQVENLAHKYGLDWISKKESAQLISLVGGHPALIQLSLYYLCYQEITLQELIHEAIANGGIYRYHLWRDWVKLQQNPTLAQTYALIVRANQNVYIDPVEVYKLDSLGLIRFEGDRILPRCQLYHAYFLKQLSTII